VELPCYSLDYAVKGKSPTLIKIDVEGFEYEVLRGAERTLIAPSLIAIIIELNSSGKAYGFEDADIHSLLTNVGFSPFGYDPEGRTLTALAGPKETGSTIYVRDVMIASARIRVGPRISVFGREI
jgi:hypothetical protein